MLRATGLTVCAQRWHGLRTMLTKRAPTWRRAYPELQEAATEGRGLRPPVGLFEIIEREARLRGMSANDYAVVKLLDFFWHLRDEKVVSDDENVRGEEMVAIG